MVVPTTSSFYKGYPLEGKPPTEAELSFKAKCTQALLLNLGSRLGLHGGWDPEGGASFVVWTYCRAVVGVRAGPGPGTQETSPAGHCQGGDGGASLTQGVLAPSTATHLQRGDVTRTQVSHTWDLNLSTLAPKLLLEPILLGPSGGSAAKGGSLWGYVP